MTRKSLKRKLQPEDIVFEALGGVSEVGATSYFIKWKGFRILIDAGKRNTGDKLKPDYYELEKEIDVLFITHLHQDHIGSVMEYYDFFNFKKIISTRETRDVFRPILKDSQKLLRRNDKQEPLKYYSDEKINQFINDITPYKHEQVVTLDEELGLEFILIRTSHLVGSAGVLLSDEDYALFITSDFTESKKFFHPRTYFEPAYQRKVDTVVTESTYGNNEESEKVLPETTLDNLEYHINKVFNHTDYAGNLKSGNVFFPAFATGRTQEIILALLKLIRENRLPYTTKIRVPFKLTSSGTLAEKLTVNYFAKYKNIVEEELGHQISDDFKEFVRNNLEPIDIWENSEEFFDNTEQILIASPGMLGEYKSYLPKNNDIYQVMEVALAIIESERHGIIFPGYQAPGTLGHKLQHLSYGESFRYYGRKYTRNTPYIHKVSFPGHVSAKGLLSLIYKINPDNVILTHGDIKSSRNIARAVRDHNINVMVPEIEEDIYLFANGEPSFFSIHHKFSNLVVGLDDQLEGIKLDKAEYILENDKFKEIKLIKALNYIVKNYEPLSNHIEILVKSKTISQSEQHHLEEELRNKGYSVDIITLNTQAKDKDYLFRELLEVISETALGSRETFRVFFTIENYFYNAPCNILAQLFNEELFYVTDQFEILKLPNLPVDLDLKNYKALNEVKGIKQETILTDLGHGESSYAPSDYYEILDRVYYYKKGDSKHQRCLTELLPNQLPKYKHNNILFRKDLFANKNKSLWGKQIENIYDIKNYKAVDILLNITDKLNQQITEIEFTNYIIDYSYNNYYGEVVGFSENEIYYRLILENGLQYLTIKLGFNVNVRECIKEIAIKKE